VEAIIAKLKEVLFSVLPITGLVLILNFTLTPVTTPLIIRFLVGAVLIVLGLTIFLLGVDIGITPIGNHMGSGVARSNKLWIVALAGLVLGFFISVAEPDLHILAGQVESVTSGQISKIAIVLVVSAGIALMVAVGLSRIIYNFPLYKLLLILYIIIFGLALLTSKELTAIAFDASGATTGALTVPFILALATGVSKMKKDSKASEKDSFGLVAVASTGAIISVLLMSIISKTEQVTGASEIVDAVPKSLFAPFLEKLPVIAGEVALALLPILLIFVVSNRFFLKVSKHAVRRILCGLVFSFAGLVLFLLGVNAGFMEVGRAVGYGLASMESSVFLIAVAFILGMVTILAEPAVYVLTHQIEEVTSGYVKRRAVLVTLALGVAAAVVLSVIRILIPQVQLWHYLLPGYILSIALSFIVPKLFVGMAFDAGGVASGPMTATFVLAFAQGAAGAVESANVLVDAFGLIATVAMMPIISLQILGLIYKIKSAKVKEGS